MNIENINGIKSARSAAEGAKDVQVVITMLPDGEILKKVAEEKETATCELSGAENFLKSI